MVYSLLNLPQKLTKEELLQKLNIIQSDVARLYKKSLYWILVTTDDKANEEIEAKLKQTKFEDGKLIFDCYNKNQLIRNISKQIQTYNYQKEAHDLKAEKKISNNNNLTSSGNKERTNSEAFSWRKKSIEQGGSSINSPKMSTDITNTNSFKQNRNSNLISPNGHKDSFNFKRERFNSEGNNPNTSKYNNNDNNYNNNFNNKFNYNSNSNNYNSNNPNSNNNFKQPQPHFEELEIDITNIKYSLNLKFKYPLHEMIAHYDYLNSKKILDTKPQFKVEIPEICNEKKKEINNLVLQKGRERSYTTNFSLNNFTGQKNKLDAQNNYSSNNEKKMSFSGNYTTNAPNDFTSGTGMKIPKNNPLGNIVKNFNKYDDPNLQVNPLSYLGA